MVFGSLAWCVEGLLERRQMRCGCCVELGELRMDAASPNDFAVEIDGWSMDTVLALESRAGSHEQDERDDDPFRVDTWKGEEDGLDTVATPSAKRIFQVGWRNDALVLHQC